MELFAKMSYTYQEGLPYFKQLSDISLTIEDGLHTALIGYGACTNDFYSVLNGLLIPSQ